MVDQYKVVFFPLAIVAIMVSKCRVVAHSYIFIVVSLLLGMDHGYPANFLGGGNAPTIFFLWVRVPPLPPYFSAYAMEYSYQTNTYQGQIVFLLYGYVIVISIIAFITK